MFARHVLKRSHVETVVKALKIRATTEPVSNTLTCDVSVMLYCHIVIFRVNSSPFSPKISSLFRRKRNFLCCFGS